MSDNNSESSGFRVVDKRRFDDSGEARPGESDNSSRSQSAQVQSQKPDAKSAGTLASAGTKQVSQSAQSQPAPQEGEGVDFSSLIMSLATQALVMLGEIPSPDGTRGPRNLDGAHQTIDIIGLLKEKTNGNLTSDETRLIDEVLAQLRMAFVHSVGK